MSSGSFKPPLTRVRLRVEVKPSVPEIKFSVEKAGRWLDRIEKRLSVLSAEDQAIYQTLRGVHNSGKKLDSQQAKALWTLEKKL